MQLYKMLGGIICVFAVAFAAADVSAAVLLRHFPAHPLTGVPVQFSVRASGSVERIVISYDRSVLSADEQGNPIQRIAEENVTVSTCDPSEIFEMLWCFGEVPAGFPAASLVTVRGTAVHADGREETDTYSFAAGTFPWSDLPIPVRVTGPIEQRLDIIFLADSDIGLDEFRTRLISVIYEMYFRYTTYLGTPEVHYRNMYNFYYADEIADYEEICRFTMPSNAAVLGRIGDALAILHKEELRDCKFGKSISSEIDYEKTLIHENGHILFGLQDEYCCDSSYAHLSVAPNIWGSREECEMDAPNLGYPHGMCVQLTSQGRSINFWRIDPTGAPGSIMGPAQHTLPSDHLNANLRRILWRFSQCLEGSCFPGVRELETESARGGAIVAEFDNQPDAGISLPQLQEELKEKIEAIQEGQVQWAPPPIQREADTASFNVQLNLEGFSAELEDIEVLPWPATETASGTDLRIRALDRSGSVLYETMVEDPRWVEIEGEEWRLLDQSPLTIVLPAQRDLSAVEILPGPTSKSIPGALGEVMMGEPSDVTPSITVELGAIIDELCAEREGRAACADR